MIAMCVESMTGIGKAAKRGAVDWLSLTLSLAATPTFALMALLVGVFGDGSGMHGSGMHGSGSHGSGGPLDGMVLMYLLMGVFHAVPWLKLLAIGRKRKQAV